MLFGLDPSSLLVLHQHLWQVRSEANPVGGCSPTAIATTSEHVSPIFQLRKCYMEAHTGHKPTQGRRRHVFFCSFLECSKHSKAIKVCPQWCFINKGSLDIGDSKVRKGGVNGFPRWPRALRDKHFSPFSHTLACDIAPAICGAIFLNVFFMFSACHFLIVKTPTYQGAASPLKTC